MDWFHRNESTMLGIVTVITMMHMTLLANNIKPAVVLPKKMVFSYTIQLALLMIVLILKYTPT